MELQVTVLICDVCKERDVPAKKYLLAIGESEPKRRDLCDRDAAPVLAAFGLSAEQPVAETAPETKQPPAPATKTAAKKTAAKKTAAKRTAAKKTAAKKATPKKTLGARETTLEEIAAEKAKNAAGTA
ncbi:hypothetical protein ACFY97_10300 [Streptomyces klenkii]|uniref:hypothetical protein n=1 Tax=Streptomyces klenkii TaxID=1420899 RepID=UPI0036EC80EE